MSDYIFHDLRPNVRLIFDFLNKPLSDDFAKLIAEQCTFKGMMKNVGAKIVENIITHLLLATYLLTQIHSIS